MPSTITPRSIFEISELAKNIFRYLQPEDLILCCLVSKLWYKSCHFLVWRVIVFRPVPTRYSKLHQLLVADQSQHRQAILPAPLPPGRGGRGGGVHSYRNPHRLIPGSQPPPSHYSTALASRLAMVEDLTIDLIAFPSLKPEASVKHLLALCASNVRVLRLVGTGTMTVSFRGFQRLQSIDLENPCPALVTSLKH
ncbi:hypothetical protein DFQ27_008912, partial [Actinomortierella ambigua]